MKVTFQIELDIVDDPALEYKQAFATMKGLAGNVVHLGEGVSRKAPNALRYALEDAAQYVARISEDGLKALYKTLVHRDLGEGGKSFVLIEEPVVSDDGKRAGNQVSVLVEGDVVIRDGFKYVIRKNHLGTLYRSSMGGYRNESLPLPTPQDLMTTSAAHAVLVQVATEKRLLNTLAMVGAPPLDPGSSPSPVAHEPDSPAVLEGMATAQSPEFVESLKRLEEAADEAIEKMLKKSDAQMKELEKCTDPVWSVGLGQLNKEEP